MTDLQAAIDVLYATPLDGFVAERTRLAKELRAAGDREGAAELAKLPKPSAAAWALNHVARCDPASVEAWLDAAADLREASAHAAEVGGDAIRSAMAAHRDATVRLTQVVADEARPGGRALSAAMLDRVRALLQAATVDAVLAERLRAGHVSEQATAEAGPAPAPTAVPPRPREPDPEEGARAQRPGGPGPAGGRGAPRGGRPRGGGGRPPRGAP